LVGHDIYAPFVCTDQQRADINRANIKVCQQLVTESQPDAMFIWNLFFLDRSFIASLAGNRQRKPLLMLTDNWLIVMLNPEFMSKFFRDHIFDNIPFRAASSASATPSAILAKGRQYLRRLVNAHRAPAPLPFRAIYGSKFVQDLYAASGIRFSDNRVVHNGIRQPPRPPQTFADRSTLLAEGELRLLFVGRLVDLKGVHTAIEALELISEMAPSLLVRLTIVGDMRDRAYVERLRAQIAQSRCAGQIELREPVPESELFGLFHHHDIYLFPSLYEPFSLTLIQALAAGIPTVASDAGGNVEIVRDKETGILFKKGDALDLAQAVRRLVNDEALRGRLAESARECAKLFTLERMVSGIEEYIVYK
jgi:glycogen(starch) synthase